jgi:small subunit ribosomal protein S2
VPLATRRELLEAGVHFGHQTKRWNPKMRRFIFGARSGIYIIDLEKTLSGLKDTWDFLVDIGRRNGVVLFVGTKKQAQSTVAEQGTRVGMPYVNTRWLGGMLTNFQTIYSRLKRLKELREMERSGAFEFLPKKEVLKLRREKEKLDRNLSGIQDMERQPDAIFVIDTKKEHIAVTEARKLGIPIVAIVDTNCDPDEVDFVIPGNDDAIRSCSLIAKVVADAIQEGQYQAYQGMQARTTEPELEREAVGPSAGPAEEEESRPVQLSEEEAAFFGTTIEAAGEQDRLEPEPEPQAEAEATAEAEAPPQDTHPAEEPAADARDTSAHWAAPKDVSELEAETHPSVTGTIDVEPVEAELDSVIEAADALPEAGAEAPSDTEPTAQPDETAKGGDPTGAEDIAEPEDQAGAEGQDRAGPAHETTP